MGGSTQSLLDLIESVKDSVKPIVLFLKADSAYEAFTRHGIECLVFPFIRLHYLVQKNSLGQLMLHPARMRLIKLLQVDLACVRYVKKYLGDRRVDIVHSNYSSVLVGRTLASSIKAKHIWHIREFLEPGVHVKNRPFGGYTFLKNLINRADGRIVISHQAQAHWGFRERNTWIIPDAVAKASDICFNPDKEPYILFCSYHVTEAKGALITVNSFGKSGLQKEGIRLRYVGNCKDDIRSEILAAANKYDCADMVDFVPCQDDVKPFFSRAKAFIMASKNEGLGRVTAEAMFYGCPVIAMDSGGTKDLIMDKETGYLFHSEDECAALLQQVCHTSQESLILTAQRFAVESMSTEVYGPRIMEVYDSVMKA